MSFRARLSVALLGLAVHCLCLAAAEAVTTTNTLVVPAPVVRPVESTATVQLDLVTTAGIMETSATEAAATTPALVLPPAPPRGFGAPEWLVKVTDAGNFEEGPALQRLPCKSYTEALVSQSPFMLQPRGSQPGGGLTGKIIYAMAGHGWTYDEERMVYYTQRSWSQGIVEDFGNADQMHIFAHLCWNSGATVVPLRPIDNQPLERIVDNEAPQCQFFGSWYRSNSDIYYGSRYDNIPYAFAYGSTEETAVARFRPYIPEDGDYPIYCWARDGEDRVHGQLYRVVHAGGVTEVRVDHRRVGKGWVWLGTYFLKQGDKAYVEVSNQMLDPYDAGGKRVVVADAIRFGNGLGDVPRPSGRSGHVREDEGDIYWIERSLGHTADRRLFTASADGVATVQTPPRTAAYMNRESEGRYSDRMLISFHSNALAGKSRGAVVLYNRDPAQRPDHQELLAQLIGTQLNKEMILNPPFDEPKWAARDRVTYNGVNFGELRKDYLQNEMVATIVESAFHDNPEDAKFLLHPKGRIDMARATLRGVLKWFATFRGANVTVSIPPMTPDDPIALALPDGRIQVSWKPGQDHALEGDPALDYRVYRSANGRGFDAGMDTQGDTAIALDPITSSGPTYIKITALNAGGESWPSQVLAVLTPQVAAELVQQDLITTPPAPQIQRALLVAGQTILDPSQNEAQRITGNLGNPRDNDKITYRVRPRRIMNAPKMNAAADALTTCGVPFDSCNAAALNSGLLDINAYGFITWSVGRQNPKEGILTTRTQVLLKQFLQRGGRLFMSGAHIAEALDGPAPKNMPTSQDREFLRQVLGLRYVAPNTDARELETVPGSIFTGPLQWELSEALNGLQDALPTDFVAPAGRAVAALRYSEPGSQVAAVQGQVEGGKGGKFVAFAFPFENLGTEENRAEAMRNILNYLK